MKDQQATLAQPESALPRIARLIAFYLPQYHPVPRNDEWWGKGFTEWRNVVDARPLYRGHDQPRLPADLGFYDLRVPEVREAQAKLAGNHGIEAFCYWHYWFGNGERMLERPFADVVSSGNPNFPFCLGWANQSWTGVWHGAPDRILMEQTYPGRDDYEKHFYTMLPAFADSRYVTVEGRKLFYVYRPHDLPDPRAFVDTWQSLAASEGIGQFFFLGEASRWGSLRESGFDGIVPTVPIPQIRAMNARCRLVRGLNRVLKKTLRTDVDRILMSCRGIPLRRRYADFISLFGTEPIGGNEYPVVVPNWDNTPRCGSTGVVLEGSSPSLFRQHVETAAHLVHERDHQRRLVFVKSWNEWAEGNYVEPDREYGMAYLQAIRDAITGE